jgi:hypothetical protein
VTEYVRVPIKEWDGCKWGQLNLLAHAHEICGEVVKKKEENYTFAGQHRVRLYTFKKNVHWKIPIGVNLDISQVAQAQPPRRQGGGR